MDRRLFVLSLSGMALSSGCVRWRRRESSVVHVAASAQLTVSPLYLALERGYFDQAGLKVEIRQFGVISEAIPLLAAGELDVGVIPINPSLINAIVKGARLRVVAGRQVLVPGCGTPGTLYGRRAAFPGGFSDTRQLKGKRIGVGPSTGSSEFFLEAMLSDAGMTLEDLTVVRLRRPEAVAALLGGKIDCIIDHNLDKDLASISQEIVKGPGVAQVLPNYQYGHIVYGRRLLDGDSRAGTAFLKAYFRGAREYVGGATPRFLIEFARANGLDPELVRNRCRGDLMLDGSIQVESLKRFLDWSVKKGYCPRSVDVAQLVDTRFLKEAK